MKSKTLGKRFAAIIAALGLLVGSIGASAPANAADLNFTYVYTPYINGSASVDGILTASFSAWSPAPNYSYQWKKNGAAIAGANSSTYKVTGEDYGETITVAVTGSLPGYVTTTRETTYGTTIYTKGYLTKTPVPTVSGTLQVGEWLSAGTSGWDEGSTFTYQWYANGFTIYGATSSTYQLQATEQGDKISVTVVGTKKGYYSETKTSAYTTAVKPSTPKITWNQASPGLKGKNVLSASAQKAFGSSANIVEWCLKLDGSPLSLPTTAKGAQFYDSTSLIAATGTYDGCYKTNSYSNASLARFRVDVTSWSVGSHSLSATAKDTNGMISELFAMTVSVEKTAPTVTPVFTAIPEVVAETFSFTGSSTTHSVTAPVSAWCIAVDGQGIDSIVSANFKSSATSISYGASDLESNQSSPGCFSSTNAIDQAHADFKIDSQLFANGEHELTVRVWSWDGETGWWSDPVKHQFKTKNKYIPTLTWSSAVKTVASRGAASSVAGSIKANIPGTPSLVTVSMSTNGGVWSKFSQVSDSNSFKFKRVFTKNTRVQIEIFDEDNNSVLTDERTILVAPLVKLSKPRIVVTQSILSNATAKTVTLPVAVPGVSSASCQARWSGGSKNFKVSSGKANVVFQTRGSGSVSVICGADSMETSKPVSIKY